MEPQQQEKGKGIQNMRRCLLDETLNEREDKKILFTTDCLRKLRPLRRLPINFNVSSKLKIFCKAHFKNINIVITHLLIKGVARKIIICRSEK